MDFSSNPRVSRGRHNSFRCSELSQLLPVTVTIVVAACGGDTALEPVAGSGDFRGRLNSQGIERTFQVHTPQGFSADRELPLLIAFHGTPGTSVTMQAITDFDREADRAQFVVAYPDAAFEEWTVGCNCNRAEIEGIQDSQFVSDLIRLLESELGIDRNRVYVAGFSNGALMTFRLACNLADELAGAAMVAATMLDNVARDCSPERPIPILIMHGSEDTEFPPGGRSLGGVTSITLEATVAKWAELKSCSADSNRTQLPDSADDGTQVWLERYSCSGGSLFWYDIQGGGHTWPGSPVEFSQVKSLDISASREIVDRLIAMLSP